MHTEVCLFLYFYLEEDQLEIKILTEVICNKDIYYKAFVCVLVEGDLQKQLSTADLYFFLFCFHLTSHFTGLTSPLCFYLQIFVLCLVSFAPSSSFRALLQLSSSSVCIASVCLGLGISKCSLKWEERQICPTTKQQELGSCVKSCGLTEQLCALTGRRSCFLLRRSASAGW